MDKKVIVTISRQHGTGGIEIGKKVAEELGIPFYDNSAMADMFETEENRNYFRESGETSEADTFYGHINNFAIAYATANETMFYEQSKVMKKLAAEGSAVFAGRCADYVLKDEPGLVRVFICENQNRRIQHIMDRRGLDQKKAKNEVKTMDRGRSTYYNYYTGKEWGNVRNSDIIINMDNMDADAAAALIVAAVKNKK